jgi:hypothetical protein
LLKGSYEYGEKSSDICGFTSNSLALCPFSSSENHSFIAAWCQGWLGERDPGVIPSHCSFSPDNDEDTRPFKPLATSSRTSSGRCLCRPEGYAFIVVMIRGFLPLLSIFLYLLFLKLDLAFLQYLGLLSKPIENMYEGTVAFKKKRVIFTLKNMRDLPVPVISKG